MKTLSSALLVLHSVVFMKASASECPPVHVDDGSSQSELLFQLTEPCRYDSQVRPVVAHGGPLLVQARMYIYYLRMTHSTTLQFKVQMLLQLRWVDGRLEYSNLTSAMELVGQQPLLERLWFPHILISNERESSIMGLTYRDQVISVKPGGEVFFTTRINNHLICENVGGKFPFDQQTCHLVMNNWRYNLSYVVLQWEGKQSVSLTSDVSSLTEFDLVRFDTTTSEDMKGVTDSLVALIEDCDSWTKYSQNESHSKSSCGIRKSSLIAIFHFNRKFGFYFWDYYVPSILLVVTSWGTFWVDPEVVPCRVWLATCTMLGFFGLGVMNDAMPKLSRLKLNDIWFIGCNLFIFLSLAEFAFVNIVHRQETKHIPLKRVSSKYILKSSLRSENVTWKRKASSCPSSPELRTQRKTVLTEKTGQQKSVAFDLAMGDVDFDVKMRRQLMRRRQAFAGTHMTNHEMANWIDRRSRVIFPLSFLVFNFLFWSVMFI